MTESLVTLREKIRDDLTSLASALSHIDEVLSKYGSAVEFTAKELDETKAVHFENRLENTLEDIQDFLHLYGKWQEALYEDFRTQ